MADTETIPEPELPLQRLGAGRAAEVFAWSPGLVVKLARGPEFEEGLQYEAAALEAAAAAGIPVPKPRGIVTHEGRIGLLMDRIEGTDVLSILEKQPWRVWSLAGMTGRLHVQLGGTPAPAGAHDVLAGARRIVAESPHVPDSARPRLLTILDQVRPGTQLCHLDFHPGNVMLSPEGPIIIDFPNAASGPALADHAKSWVILTAGSPQPDTPVLSRLLIKVFRKLARAAYMRTYRRDAPYDSLEFARWKAIAVAVRLNEGIQTERESLLRLLSSSLRAANG